MTAILELLGLLLCALPVALIAIVFLLVIAPAFMYWKECTDDISDPYGG